MSRKCGTCRHTEKGGDKLVWCFGMPPTVTNSRQAENGGITVAVQSPLVFVDRRACSLHSYGLKAMLRK